MSDEKPHNVLDNVLSDSHQLTEEEIKRVKDFLTMTSSLGTLGRWIIYGIITLGAVATTAHQLKIDLFGTN